MDSNFLGFGTVEGLNPEDEDLNPKGSDKRFWVDYSHFATRFHYISSLGFSVVLQHPTNMLCSSAGHAQHNTLVHIIICLDYLLDII